MLQFVIQAENEASKFFFPDSLLYSSAFSSRVFFLRVYVWVCVCEWMNEWNVVAPTRECVYVGTWVFCQPHVEIGRGNFISRFVGGCGQMTA